MDKELAINGDKRMTVKEVAEAFNCAENTILNAIKKYFPEIIRNGKTTYLNEAQVTGIKLEIESHHNLASTCELPKTLLEKQLLIKQAAMLQDEIIAQLTAELIQANGQLAIAAPKVEFYDQVIDSADAIQMREVAAVLNVPSWGRNKIFELLRQRKILDSDNIPYRKYQDAGYFRVVENKYTDQYGNTRISLLPLVYQSGIDYIRKLLKEYDNRVVK